ncbi:hypothetical protein M2360_000906 [Rhizobium sp. SG_E_25_P2]|nr:hypothetical protein [Rhizobium sp. SG_E_25_P2]
MEECLAAVFSNPDTALANITAGLSALSAIGALLSACYARRQARAAEAANARKLPILEVVETPIEGQPQWIALSVTVHNRADAQLRLLSVSAVRGALLAQEKYMLTDGYGGRRPQNPLPQNQAQKTLPLDAAISPPAGPGVQVAATRHTVALFMLPARIRLFRSRRYPAIQVAYAFSDETIPRQFISHMLVHRNAQ